MATAAWRIAAKYLGVPPDRTVSVHWRISTPLYDVDVKPHTHAFNCVNVALLDFDPTDEQHRHIFAQDIVMVYRVLTRRYMHEVESEDRPPNVRVEITERAGAGGRLPTDHAAVALARDTFVSEVLRAYRTPPQSDAFIHTLPLNINCEEFTAD